MESPTPVVLDWLFASLPPAPLLVREPEIAKPQTMRERLVRLVREHPGATLSRARVALGMGWGALYHHVRQLEAAGEIRTLTVGRRRILLPRGDRGRDALAAGAAALAGRTARRLAEHVATGRATDVAGLAAETGISPRTATYHLRRLTDTGLVRSRSASRYFDLQATVLLRELLARPELLDDSDGDGGSGP